MKRVHQIGNGVVGADVCDRGIRLVAHELHLRTGQRTELVVDAFGLDTTVGEESEDIDGLSLVRRIRCRSSQERLHLRRSPRDVEGGQLDLDGRGPDTQVVAVAGDIEQRLEGGRPRDRAAPAFHPDLQVVRGADVMRDGVLEQPFRLALRREARHHLSLDFRQLRCRASNRVAWNRQLMSDDLARTALPAERCRQHEGGRRECRGEPCRSKARSDSADIHEAPGCTLQNGRLCAGQERPDLRRVMTGKAVRTNHSITVLHRTCLTDHPSAIIGRG